MNRWQRLRARLGPAGRCVGGWVLKVLAANPGVSALFLPVTVDWLPDEPAPPSAQPLASGPGPGHPERLAADIPLSVTERALWRQLTLTD